MIQLLRFRIPSLATCGILVCLFMAPACFAWGDGGHMAVALRAWDAMSPADRAAAVSLIEQHPRFESDFLRRMLGNIPPEEIDWWIFASAATWPDYIWQIRLTSPRDFHKYFHARWHVIGAPIMLDPAIAPPTMRTPTTQDLNQLTIKEALPLVTAELSDAHLSSADRAVALCWVLHLTGDLHEPCHAASLISSRFKAPDGDHVATKLPVIATNHPTGLHQYWDSLFNNSTDWAKLKEWEREVLADPALQPLALPELRDHPTSDEWIAESHAIAAQDVYSPDIRASVAAQDGDSSRTFEPIYLSEDYMRHAREIGRRRGALAGLRLAATLSNVRW